MILSISAFDDFSAFLAARAADWQRIVTSSDAATVFQTPEWIGAWMRHFGAGRRFVGLAFSDGDTVVGLAALVISRGPLRILRFAGTGGSDYLDLLAQSGHETSVARAFSGWLSENTRLWDWADFQQIRPGSVAENLVAATEGEKLSATVWDGETCPFLPLAGSYDAFLKSLGKKLRGNIGYYERAMAKQFSLEMRVATAETLAADLESFFFLHQKRWRSRFLPGAFASARARAFHADAASALLASDHLRLHTLLLDGQAKASIYCFQKGARCCYYLGGFDTELSKLSPGTVLTARAIRHAIDIDGASEFDFLRGDEPYKYKWGAQDRFNRRFSVTRGGARGPLLQAVGYRSLQLETRLKHRMHASHGKAAKGEGKREKAEGAKGGRETE